jgi:hypothetical protein
MFPRMIVERATSNQASIPPITQLKEILRKQQETLDIPGTFVRMI